MEEGMEELKNYSLLPVTALHFCHLNGVEVLLEGEGPKLKVFSKEGLMLCEKHVLPFSSIHGIQVGIEADTSAGMKHFTSAGTQLLVFGEKSFCIVQITMEESKHELCCCSDVLQWDDWILAGILVEYKSTTLYTVVLVTAHNAVVMYRVMDAKIICSTVRSEVNCILYSADLVLDTAGDLVVVCGTVFNQVLVWYVSCKDGCINDGDEIEPQLTLNGHNGVIFSARLSNDETRIVSVSDDRTIRVWDLPSGWKTQQRTECGASSLVLYGHTARVWDARLLARYIVSIGEDATCRVWNYNGKCLSVIRGHQGRSIWSMAVDSEQQIVATGGGDCSIRTFHLENLEYAGELSLDTQLPERHEAIQDVPRSVLLYENTALALTNKGYLFAACIVDDVYEHKVRSSPLQPSIWKEVHYDPEFSGYSVASLSQNESGWVAFGNLKGCIKLLKLNTAGSVITSFEWVAHRGKVFSLNWSCDDQKSQQLLFSCGPEGKVTCWLVTMPSEEFEVSKVGLFTLPPSKHRWISAVLVLNDNSNNTTGSTAATPYCSSKIVICGDRKGSVHLYRCTLDTISNCKAEGVDDNAISPIQSIRVHGPNGVTCITVCCGYIYSAGRDGYCRQYNVNKDGHLSEVRKFKPVKGMDWIEELMFTDDDFLVLGFHGTNLVVHSTKQNKHVICTSCGGGHRSYGFTSKYKMISSQRASLVYIKQSTVHLKTFNLKSYFSKSVFQPAFIGREAISLAVISFDTGCMYSFLAVGSEDCDISIVKIHPQSHVPIQVVRTLQGHVSSVRALSCSSSSCDSRKRLLFSGGARASLKAWSIVAEADEMTVSLEAELSLIHTVSKKPKKAKFSYDSDALPECRIMSLTSFPLSSTVSSSFEAALDCHYIAAGCSDGLIRQYVYHERDCRFTLENTLSIHQKCILSVSHLLLADKEESQYLQPDYKPPYSLAILCSTATDGTLAIWDLQNTLFSWFKTNITSEPSVSKSGLVPSYSQCAGNIMVDPIQVVHLHQSGVNDVSLHCYGYNDSTTSYSLNIATVGDDNAVVLTNFIVTVKEGKVMTATVLKQCSYFRAHASSITGVNFIQANQLVTISIDQWINVWEIDSSNSLVLTSSHTHDIADVSSLCICHLRHGVYAVFCGVGIQYYRCD